MFFLFNFVILCKLVGLLMGVKLNLKLFVVIMLLEGVLIIMFKVLGILWVVWKKLIVVFLKWIIVFLLILCNFVFCNKLCLFSLLVIKVKVSGFV